jgi:site-specific recombinase XerD
MSEVIETPEPSYPAAPATETTNKTRTTARPEPAHETLEELLEDYGRWMRSWGAAESTVRQRCAFAGGRLEEWAAPTVEKIQAFLGRPEISKWSRATYYAHLKSFCEWLEAVGYLSSNPMDEIRRPPCPTSVPHPLSEHEVTQVLAVAEGRTRDWIEIALMAGLRVHEIAKIRGEDVDEDGLRVQGKGGKTATLPVHPDLWQIAQRYPRTGYWFPSPQGGHLAADTITCRVSNLFTSLGIHGSIHRARHTYATRLLRAGVNIRVVQKLMRHSSIQTTAGYTAVDEAELSDAIRLLPGGLA